LFKKEKVERTETKGERRDKMTLKAKDGKGGFWEKGRKKWTTTGDRRRSAQVKGGMGKCEGAGNRSQTGEMALVSKNEGTPRNLD